MSAELRRSFSDFFKEKIVSSPLVRSYSVGQRPRGWLEEARAETFQSDVYGQGILKIGSPWSELSGKIYEALSFGQSSVILAWYDDETTLWLDDHSSDADYEVFILRERLVNWLPNQMDQLVNLLIETKLNYLGRPRLIRNIADVPVMPDSWKATFAEDQQSQE